MKQLLVCVLVSKHLTTKFFSFIFFAIIRLLYLMFVFDLKRKITSTEKPQSAIHGISAFLTAMF